MKKLAVAVLSIMFGFSPVSALELGNVKVISGKLTGLNYGDKVGTTFSVAPLAAPAGNKAGEVYRGSVNYSSSNGFSALQQLGVKKAAEDRAIANCQAAGLLGCVAIGSVIGACNTYSCEATATALDLVPFAGAVVFSGAASYSSSDGFSALEQLGVRKHAEEKAVANCQAEGLIGCVAINSVLGACNTYRCEAAAKAQSRKKAE